MQISEPVPLAAQPPALPLTVFERYILADDSADYPMMPLVELDLHGSFDRARLETAVAGALGRNVLLQARVERVSGRWQWKHEPNVQPLLDWQRDTVPIESVDGGRIDLRREIGLRLYVRQRADGARMIVHFHHACTDGYGMAAFLDDVMAGYVAAGDAQFQPPPYRATRHDRLLERGTFEPPVIADDRPRTLRQRLRDVSSFLRQRPVPLQATEQRPANGQRRINPLVMFKHVFDAGELARGSEARLNDLALARLFLVLRDWNRQHAARRQQPLRVLVPTDLRRRGDEAMPAANASGFAFVTRRLAELKDEATLLASLRAELQAVQRERHGAGFLQDIGSLLAVPGALPAALRFGGCAATAVLSYMGDPTRRLMRYLPRDEQGRVEGGGLRIEHFFFAPPVRRGTRLSVGLTRYAGRVHLGLTCDPWLYTPDDAQSLLTMLVDATRTGGA